MPSFHGIGPRYNPDLVPAPINGGYGISNFDIYRGIAEEAVGLGPGVRGINSHVSRPSLPPSTK